MPAPGAQPPRRLARLASVLSVRTISGKLIIGLIVLFALASVVISVVTAQSLNNSLMSSLKDQLQAATTTWTTCAASTDRQQGDGDGDNGQPTPGYDGCSGTGQASGTFLAVLSSGGTVVYKDYVTKTCTLSAADHATLVGLPAMPPGRSSRAPDSGARPAGPRGPDRRRPRRPISGPCSASSSCSPRCRIRTGTTWSPGCR